MLRPRLDRELHQSQTPHLYCGGTVGQLKGKIEEQLYIPTCIQFLTVRNSQLQDRKVQDEESLDESDLVPDDTIQIHVDLRAGITQKS